MNELDDSKSLAETIAEFLQTVVSDSQERRVGPRYDYRVVQSVAPYDSTRLPTSDMFLQVQCRDLSKGGMSFIWPNAADFSQVVIRLQTPGRTLGLVGRVARSRPLDGSDSEFLVGCEFIDRVSIPEVNGR